MNLFDEKLHTVQDWKKASWMWLIDPNQMEELLLIKYGRVIKQFVKRQTKIAYTPFIFSKVQALNPADYLLRLNFCQCLL